MADRETRASVDRLRLGAGFHPDEHDEVAERLRKLDRRLRRFDADSVELDLSVRDRGSNEQRVVLDARFAGFDQFIATSDRPDLRDALAEVRDDLWRQLDDALGRLEAARRG